jgi:paraquat-inducible protein A
MVDVFVVAILVGIVQLGSVLRIDPGAGALAFAGVVVLTMLAARSFDPRLIWDAAAARERATMEDVDAETTGARDADHSASHA